MAVALRRLRGHKDDYRYQLLPSLLGRIGSREGTAGTAKKGTEAREVMFAGPNMSDSPMSVCGGGAQKARGGQWLSLSAAVLLTLAAAALPQAMAMPDTRGRALWREVVSSSSPSSPPPERACRKDAALAQGAQRARARGKFKANALDLPGHWVRSEDPEHPRMRCPVELKDAHSMNTMPENSFFKDHDSDVRSPPHPCVFFYPPPERQLVMIHSMLIPNCF